jgi:hypothetical protein
MVGEKDDFEICPHCKKRGIFVSVRRYYSRGWPAVCRECGGLSYDRPFGIWCLSGNLTLTGVLLYFVAMAGPWWLKGLIFSGVLALIVWIWRIHQREKSATFRPITPRSSRVSRQVFLGGLLAAFVFAILLSWFIASRPASPDAPFKIKLKWPTRGAFAPPSQIPIEAAAVAVALS